MNTSVTPNASDVQGEIIFLRETPFSEFLFSERVDPQDLLLWPLRLPASMLSSMSLFGTAPLSFLNTFRSLRMVAGLRLVYPDIQRPDFFDDLGDEEIRQGLTETFHDSTQSLFDAQFGKGRAEVTISRYNFSSLEVIALVFTGAGLAVTFVKDYPELRKNMTIIVNDIKELGNIFSRALRSMTVFKSQRPGSKAVREVAA